ASSAFLGAVAGSSAGTSDLASSPLLDGSTRITTTERDVHRDSPDRQSANEVVTRELDPDQTPFAALPGYRLGADRRSGPITMFPCVSSTAMRGSAEASGK